jgi:hypothetical protein
MKPHDPNVNKIYQLIKSNLHVYKTMDEEKKAQKLLKFIEHYNPNFSSLLIYNETVTIELLIVLKNWETSPNKNNSTDSFQTDSFQIQKMLQQIFRAFH